MKQLLIRGEKIQEVDHADIFDLFNSDIRNLVRDLSNYRPAEDYYKKKNLLKCVKCETIIEKPSCFDHFLLWTKDNTHYICFHFRCAFKTGTADGVNELLRESADAVNEFLREFAPKAPI